MENYCSRKLKMPFEEAVAKTMQSLQQQGFNMITMLDLKSGMKQNLNADFRDYKIVFACNPQLAYNAISIESHIGLFLPAHIVIQQHENGELEISAINPMETMDNTLATTNLPNIAAVISNHLRMAIDDVLRNEAEPDHKEALPVYGNEFEDTSS
jgi:uncharacterized protein (DUF302 family)